MCTPSRHSRSLQGRCSRALVDWMNRGFGQRSETSTTASGQLDHHHMDDLHGRTTKVSAYMHSIPTFTNLLLRPTCCVFMHKLAKCRHLHEWFRSSTQHWDLTLWAVLTQSCFQRFKVCTAEQEPMSESGPKFHWITADVYMDLCMCVQMRLLR